MVLLKVRGEGEGEWCRWQAKVRGEEQRCKPPALGHEGRSPYLQ